MVEAFVGVLPQCLPFVIETTCSIDLKSNAAEIMFVALQTSRVANIAACIESWVGARDAFAARRSIYHVHSSASSIVAAEVVFD